MGDDSFGLASRVQLLYSGSRRREESVHLGCDRVEVHRREMRLPRPRARLPAHNPEFPLYENDPVSSHCFSYTGHHCIGYSQWDGPSLAPLRHTIALATVDGVNPYSLCCGEITQVIARGIQCGLFCRPLNSFQRRYDRQGRWA